MSKKTVIFVFNGDPMCFVHVLLNALDMNAGGHDVKVVIEGAAVKLIKDFADGSSPLLGLYSEVKEKGLIDAVCRACSAKLGMLDAVEKEGLPIADEMSGHVSMNRYLEAGYELITF